MPQIGHVHLKVSNLERSIEFYQNVLGMKLRQRMGSSAAFLAFDNYHHHLGLNVWQSKGGTAPAPNNTGLFHFAVLFSTRKELAIAVKRIVEHGVTLDGAADHGVSEAIYFRDPDQNGIEIYWDRPMDEWPMDSLGVAMFTRPLNLQDLISEAD